MDGRIPGDPTAPRDDRHDFWGVVLDAPDAHELARFYADLLGWPMQTGGLGFATVAPPDGVAYLGFQTSEGYREPVWPNVEGEQQMMLHVDVEVSDLSAAVADAVAKGAREATHQPQTDVRVMLDPAGHPFCLYASG